MTDLRDSARCTETRPIVYSLIFVGVQIRQNSEVSEVNAYQDLVSQITLMNSLRAQDAEFANLFWRFDHGEQPRSDTERARLEAFLYMVFRHGDLAYRQYDRGLIARDGLISTLAPTRTFLNTELGKQVWATLSPSLQPGYVAFVKEVGLLCGSYTGTSSYCELKRAPPERPVEKWYARDHSTGGSHEDFSE